jgi:hypothetical protein
MILGHLGPLKRDQYIRSIKAVAIREKYTQLFNPHERYTKADGMFQKVSDLTIKFAKRHQDPRRAQEENLTDIILLLLNLCPQGCIIRWIVCCVASAVGQCLFLLIYWPRVIGPINHSTTMVEGNDMF